MNQIAHQSEDQIILDAQASLRSIYKHTNKKCVFFFNVFPTHFPKHDFQMSSKFVQLLPVRRKRVRAIREVVWAGGWARPDVWKQSSALHHWETSHLVAPSRFSRKATTPDRIPGPTAPCNKARQLLK